MNLYGLTSERVSGLFRVRRSRAGPRFGRNPRQVDDTQPGRGAHTVYATLIASQFEASELIESLNGNLYTLRALAPIASEELSPR